MQNIDQNINEFIENFDIVDNALQMRCLQRWNGRDLRTKENLAEHTHLVCACLMKLYDDLCKLDPVMRVTIDLLYCMKKAMLHDSLELLRGDILSTTKDVIPNLRFFTDNEEMEFMNAVLQEDSTSINNDLVKLADLMACYKFVEYELRFPSNNFASQAYIQTKRKFDKEYRQFLTDYHLPIDEEGKDLDYIFAKGYAADAGIDVLLSEDVTFMPMSSTTYNLKVNMTPDEGVMGILCSRTSAANKGLIVAMCPIDPHYSGDVMAIVHNVSNNIITYKKGEAFCQIVALPFINSTDGVKIKKEGKRTTGNLGSTNETIC